MPKHSMILTIHEGIIMNALKKMGQMKDEITWDVEWKFNK